MLSFYRSRPALREPALRLFWFHHAGGTGQSYRSWSHLFPSTWDIVFVEYPGRGQNAHLPPVHTIGALSDLILPAVEPLFDVPYAMCGHSMGSLIAFTITRLAYEWAERVPLWLGVSGRQAPHLPSRSAPPLYTLPDDELATAIEQMGGTPVHLLSDPQFRVNFLDVMRADFQVCETHTARRVPQIDVPVSAYFGADDPTLSLESMRAWKDLTSGEFRLHRFSGGHFFLAAQKAEFAQCMIDDIAAAGDAASIPHLRVA